MKTLFLTVSSWLALLSLSAALVAQAPCSLGDDGFNLGCCATPNPNLPPLTGVSLTASYLCIDRCLPPSVRTGTVTLTTPAPLQCDMRTTNLSAVIPVGLASMSISGTLYMKYARTWMEPLPTGAFSRQVWRFLVNGDLSYTTNSTASLVPCPMPQAAAAPYNRRIPMDGHIDYACEPGVAGFRALLSLHHLQGCVSWGALSATPLAALAGVTYSYHLVGPNPFLTTAQVEPQSPNIQLESLRTARIGWAPFSYFCISEEQVRQGSLATTQTDCLCAALPPIAGLPWRQQKLDGFSCCNGVLTPFMSVPFAAGTIPSPTGLAVQTLGRFNGAAGTFPGQRHVFHYMGQVVYGPPCLGTTTITHLVTGVATANHQFRPFLVGSNCLGGIATLPRAAIDLGNKVNRTRSSAAGSSVQAFAGLSYSSQIWNLDI